jgi:signal transduction histidine kinase
LPFSELKLCTKFPAIVKEMFEKEIVNLNVSEISSLMLKIILQNKVSTGLDFLIRFSDCQSKTKLNACRGGPDEDIKYYDIELIYDRFESRQSLIYTMKDLTDIASMKFELTQQDEKDRMLAHSVHDMRAPLNAIMGYSEILIEEFKGNFQIKEHADIIQANALHLSQLVGDFLDGVKMKNKVLNINPTTFDLNTLLSDCMKVLKVFLRNKEAVRTEIHCPKNIMVTSDFERLKRLLLNLLTNSAKFTSKGKVGIEVIDCGLVLILKVKDTGTGIPEYKQKNLFQEWSTFTDETGTINREGSGLGLSIAKKIVDLLGPLGNIDIESTLGNGSQFSCLIWKDTGADHENYDWQQWSPDKIRKLGKLKPTPIITNSKKHSNIDNNPLHTFGSDSHPSGLLIDGFLEEQPASEEHQITDKDAEGQDSDFDEY